MFESTGFNQFNMPEIEHIGYDETLKEEVREYEKPNNERLLPTTKETLGEKSSCMGCGYVFKRCRKESVRIISDM